jgi:ribose transport system substrate-binding protein
MKHVGTLYFAVVVALATLGSCQKSYHEDTERYVFVASNIKLPYWERAQEGLMDSAKVLKVKATFTGPDRYDPNAELKVFQDVAASHPSGILVSPARPELFQDAINAAVQAGIPVICVDSDSPASQRLLFIGTNNFRAGMESGEQIAELMHEHGSLVLITIPGQFNLDERARGVEEVLKKYKSIHITNIVNDSGVSQLATDNLSNLLRNKAPMDGILCLEASGGPGAAKALDNVGMAGKIPIVAMDANPETLDWISKGVIAATVAQKPYSMVFYGLRMLDDLHHNVVHQFQDWRTAPTSPLPRVIDTGTAVINARNVEDFKEALATVAARQ